jgi:hypothetical protein
MEGAASDDAGRGGPRELIASLADPADGDVGLDDAAGRELLFSSTVLLDGASLGPEGMPECVASMRSAVDDLRVLAERFPVADPGAPTGAATAMVLDVALERLEGDGLAWFWVPDATSRWLVPAASELPADITCDAAAVPRSGVVAFESQLLSPGGDGVPCPVRAALWFVAPLVGAPGDGVYVVWFADPSSLRLPSMPLPASPLSAGSVSPAGWSVWGHGDGLRDGCGRGDPDAHDWDRRVLSTLWHLLANPQLARVDEVMAPRAARRRAQRLGVSPPAAVRVLHLAPTRVGHSGGGGGSRSVRWWVSGHWRSQPYGPQRSLRRPVWIAAHVRGPQGAPLRAPRPTVVAVDRPR